MNKWIFGYGLVVLAVFSSVLVFNLLYFWFTLLFIVSTVMTFGDGLGGGYSG